jgi:hypothetical protein
MQYNIKANNSLIEICNLHSQINTWDSEITTMTETVVDYTEEIMHLTSNIDIYDETINTHNETVGIHNNKRNTHNEVTEIHTETSREYNEFRESYYGCIQEWELHTDHYRMYYQTEMLMEQQAFACMTGIENPVVPIPEPPIVTDVEFDEKAHYPETDGIQKCIRKYNECIEATLAACSTTLVDPRTMKEYTRIDWEKYHASIKSCKESYEQCVNPNMGKECDICSPEQGTDEWVCTPCHDPNCPEKDKEWIFYQCPDKCKGTEEVPEKKIDPWKNCEQEDV